MKSVADALRPSPADALASWAARVRADHEQVERSRESADPADFYAPVADRFRLDPRRTDDSTLDVLRSLAGAGETWLDVGSGGGRFALPLALIVGEVICVEPSPSMIEVLQEGMHEHGIGNVTIVPQHWPLANPGGVGPVDVALMAHIGYDIEEIGPFLDAVEAVTSLRCVAVMGEGAMTTVASLLWEPVHGEPRVALPALPELATLLFARGRIPEIRLVDRVPPSFGSKEDLLAMARRQLWLRPGSAKDARLRELVQDRVEERHGRFALDWAATRIGIVVWEPPAAS
ncbi:MAG: class I SAM-dependent methyltransferase [Chloroflexota bacterium]|nr:class I SAM-dependent methyltransferase [Chloroflexota bacterium]